LPTFLSYGSARIKISKTSIEKYAILLKDTGKPGLFASLQSNVNPGAPRLLGTII
jgi:hypothetical protein